jgi:pseudaminic acid cytidylyltransferase
MKVAIIPARGGSKRIPRKNIKNFNGKPIIAWSIEAAIRSRCFDQIVVSTDDDEIAKIAIQYGSSVPFIRPAELSCDHTTTTPVIAHAIDWLQTYKSKVEFACCIYATAPLLQSDDIRKGLKSMQDNDSNYAFAVTNFQFPIQRALKIQPAGGVQMFNDAFLSTRSQDLEPAYHDAGQFYWGKAEAWLNQSPVYDLNSIPIVIPHYRVQDIDTPEDWIRAELLAKALGHTFG